LIREPILVFFSIYLTGESAYAVSFGLTYTSNRSGIS
jgi:hypothetical protein